ncbi:MAG: restriction endonuclease [Alcaligenaceae bacterium]|nr:restriction endonuclease [Alcaligenaceae bacterium]
MSQETVIYVLVLLLVLAGAYLVWRRNFNKGIGSISNSNVISSGNISNIPEEEIARLVNAIFREKGYRVQKTSEALKDVADFQLEKAGFPAFVSIKCWGEPKVDVNLFSQIVIGMNQQNSSHNYVITTGVFDTETIETAKYSSNLVLIDGNKLKTLIASVK